MGTSRVRTFLPAVLCLVWAVAVSAGLAKLWAYAYTPGPAALAAEGWPAATRVPRDAQLPTLVMFVHPQCGCSRATIAELANLMAHVKGRLTVHVLVYRPANAPPRWERTDLWESASQIPGVAVSTDEDAKEALVFGARVSGQTLLYDRDGRLTFSGGITFARGHSGDNLGRSAIQSIVAGGTAATRRTPVFGCFLSGGRSPDAVSRRPPS